MKWTRDPGTDTFSILSWLAEMKEGKESLQKTKHKPDFFLKGKSD